MQKKEAGVNSKLVISSRFKLNHWFTVPRHLWEGCGYLIRMHVFSVNLGSSNVLKMLQNIMHQVQIFIFAFIKLFWNKRIVQYLLNYYILN